MEASQHVTNSRGRQFMLTYHPQSMDAHYVDIYEIDNANRIWKASWYVKEFMALPESGRFGLSSKDLEPLKEWVRRQALNRSAYMQL